MEATETYNEAQLGGFASTDEAYDALKKPQRRREFRHNLFVLESLVTRDFKLKYRRSVLGILWSLLNPLLMMIVMAAVFSMLFKFSIDHFPVYLILGTIMFDFMGHSTSGAMNSIIDNQSLIKKIRIDKMVFPLEQVVFELINFAISLIAVAIVMAYFQVVPSVHALWGLPFIVITLCVFSVGLSLLLSALVVFFRDVGHLWSVVITAWTYATPIFYPGPNLDAAGDMFQPWMVQIMELNPMYHFITFFRNIMMWNTNPGIMESLICLGMAVITLIVGFIVFRSVERRFILHI